MTFHASEPSPDLTRMPPNRRVPPRDLSSMTTYVALLRGINVGGKNLIKMPALKACFEENGFEDVATYIQSGNVLFSSPEDPNRRS